MQAEKKYVVHNSVAPNITNLKSEGKDNIQADSESRQ